MNAKDINQSYDLLALAQGDSKLKHAGKYYIGACPFCGGTDRFNLKQTAEGWRWLCRNCTDARYKSPIDYVMHRESLDFKQALDSMGGKASAAAPRPRVEPAKPQPLEDVLPSPYWQAQRWPEITSAMNALKTNKPARDYLQSRALDPSTWLVYRLGFAIVYDPITENKRPAILIPWWDEVETITAIKYRFVDDVANQDKKKRFGMARGSKPILFGLHAAASQVTLILCEGEFNAMSISQIAAREVLHLDAISFGSQNGGYAEILREVASDYQRVIVWADDPTKANDIRISLACHAEALCSPEIDGMKYDANALLQKGYLAEFLKETTFSKG